MIIYLICQYVNIWYLPYPNTKADHRIATIFCEILSAILEKNRHLILSSTVEEILI